MDISTANRLVQYRKLRGLSQEELAAALGLSRQAVSKWERAEASPDTDNLIALVRLYGVSLDELLLSEAPPTVQPQPDVSTVSSAAAMGYREAPAAPVPDLVDQALESELMRQLAQAVQTDDDPTVQDLLQMGVKTAREVNTAQPTAEHAPSEERPPLSPAARRIMDFSLVFIWIIISIALRMVVWLFPSLMGSYPILCTIFYLCAGFMFGKWHPTWLVFLCVPLFYM